MLPRVDDLGRVFVFPSGTPVQWNSGVGYTADGRMCITSVSSPTDAYVGGWRLDLDGRVVVANAVPEVARVYNGGLPFNNAGTFGNMGRQIDVVPSANDPYVRGIRVGPAGGVYMTLAVPPITP